MPRFANGETGRKSQSDTIQKMKRQLATAISRHATLQHENQQLHQEYQLLQAVCSALDWLRQQTGEDEELVNTAEELLLLQQMGLEAASPPTEAPDAAALTGTTDATPGHLQGTVAANIAAVPAAGHQNRGSMSTGSGGNSTDSGGDRGPSSSALPASNQQGSWSAPTAAPADDAMQLFKRILSMPLVPSAETMSIAELLAAYTGYVKELSMSNQLYEATALAGSSTAAPQLWPQGQAPLERMEDSMCRYLQLLVSLFKVKRQGLIQELCLTNLESVQLLQEPVREHYAWVMPQLGLTTEQQQRIATGVRVFKCILTPSLQELRKLQLADNAAAPAAPGQQQQQHSGATSSSSDMQVSEDAADSIDKAAGSSTAAAAGLSQDAAAAAAAAGPTTLEAAAAAGAAMSAAFAPVSAAHVAYRQRLDKQERRSARINTLLRKDFLHRICFCGYVYGCMSWPQQAKLHCRMWPYNPMVLINAETTAQVAPQGPSRRPRGRPRLHPRPQ